jgi:putative ABC transport system ATP-binding protein
LKYMGNVFCKIGTQHVALDPTKVLLQLHGLSREYQFEDHIPVAALNGIDLDIFQGEFVAITGHSGSGKSTLLNMIGLLDESSRGTILFNGQDTSHLSERERTEIRLRSMGFIFQFFNLIESYTAEENIIFQLRLQGHSQASSVQKAKEIFEFLGLQDRAHLLPRQLSGGEQQRIAIGRAVAKDSVIILADEPTAHLDSENSRNVMDLLYQVNKCYGKTIVLVTHEPEEAARASRQISMADGKIIKIQRRPAGDGVMV